MGFFDTCRPSYRFYANVSRRPYGAKGVQCNIYDWDQRRVITIATAWEESDDNFFFGCLADHIDDLPADVALVEVAQDGSPVYWSTHTDLDELLVPFYPRLTDFPPGTSIIQRGQLEEIDRIGVQVDHASYRPQNDSTEEQHVAFKYYFSQACQRAIWHEANCLIHIPQHPGILPLHSLVVDRIFGEEFDRVVGFTTKFNSGNTVEANKSRVFKLKYLQQLFDAIDFLNLHLGIVHCDIHMRNLLVDHETDHLQLFDFNWAARLGQKGDITSDPQLNYDPDRNDVKGAIFTVYEIITRDTHFRDEKPAENTHSSMVTTIRDWKAHRDVHLDAEPGEYRMMLEKWVETRGKTDKEVTHYEQTPLALDWPSFPKYDLAWVGGRYQRVSSRWRQSLIRNGQRFLSWQRPPSSEMPCREGQKLLVTGQIVARDEIQNEAQDGAQEELSGEKRRSKRLKAT